MNKSIWLEMATTTTTTTKRSTKQVQCNVRRLGEAKFFRGHSGGLVALKRFLFSFLSFPSFEVSVTFLSTSCFLRWKTVPTLFELLHPSFPFPCCLFKTPSYIWWPASHFSDMSFKVRASFSAVLYTVCKQLYIKILHIPLVFSFINSEQCQ